MTTKRSKLAAIDLLLKGDALKPAISQTSTLSRNAITNLQEGIPIEISPEACRPWKFADRPLAETEHRAELMKSFGDNGVGQLQPIVVRPATDPETPEITHEVICGRVRWMAAKELGIPVKAIVRDLSDQEAYVVMSVENRQRKDISDWAKAKSYERALALGIFKTAQQLAEAEAISKSTLSYYLGFAALPEIVADKFDNIARISYRTGYAIAKACEVTGVDAVLPLINKIESGEISRNDLERMRIRAVNTAPASPADYPEPQDAMASQPLSDPRVFPLPELGSIPTDTEAEGRAGATARLALSGTGGETRVTDKPWHPDQGQPDGQESSEEDRASPASARTRVSAHPSIPVSWREDPHDRPLRKTFVSVNNRALFSYHQASRGWLIRINPEVSMEIDESLILEIGALIEQRITPR
jgi:ParB/RepB/Spo0J family partition protein